MTAPFGGQQGCPVPEQERPVKIDESRFASEQSIEPYAQDRIHDDLGSGHDIVRHVAEIGHTRTKEKLVSYDVAAAIEDGLAPEVNLHQASYRTDRESLRIVLWKPGKCLAEG